MSAALSNIEDKISQAYEWIGEDNARERNYFSSMQTSSNNLSGLSNLAVNNSDLNKSITAHSITSDDSFSNVIVDGADLGSISNYHNWGYSGGSAGTSTTPYQNWNQIFTDISDVAKFNREDETSKLEDLKTEIEDKLEECDSKIDDIFNQMKEDRSKTTLMGPVFQYYVGMRLAYETILNKIKKYVENDKEKD